MRPLPTPSPQTLVSPLPRPAPPPTPPPRPPGHVCDALHAAEHVSALLLDGVWASAAGWQALAAAIKVNTSLRKLR